MSKTAFLETTVAELTDKVTGLRALLDTHQELSRVQGNRILELETELMKTSARLRAADITIATLQTQLRATAHR